MTRHKHAQTGLGTPSPLDPWINAMLRMLAMLLSNVASTFRMKACRARVNATPTMPRDLPQRTTDTQFKETPAVLQDSPTALILRSAAELRISKDEAVLTTPCVSLATRAIHLLHTACGGGKQRIVATKGILPPPVRSTGGVDAQRRRLRVLARKTEGAALRAQTPNKNAAA